MLLERILTLVTQLMYFLPYTYRWLSHVFHP